MFKVPLVSFLQPEHELCLLARKIDWDAFEKDFEPLYGTVCRSSVQTRKMVGLLLFSRCIIWEMKRWLYQVKFFAPVNILRI